MTYLPGTFVPTGVLLPHGGGSAPTGFLLCDGAAVSRTTYADLFAVIAELFGVGDGSTTFNVPDTQGKIPVGKGASGVTNIGDTGGEQDHTLLTAEMPAHEHLYLKLTGSGGTQGFTVSNAHFTSDNTGSAGGDGAHNNMQPYVGTEYIIKT